MWSRQSDRVNLSDTLMNSIVSADLDSFPNIRILLVLRLLCLPDLPKQRVEANQKPFEELGG